MKNTVIIVLVILVVFMALQQHVAAAYTASRMTDLDTERPVTWNVDWGGGPGYSRFLINGEIS